MRNSSSSLWISCAVLSLIAASCAPPRAAVVAIANEGFLVRSGREAVLVDALFRATAPYPEFYQQGPSEMLLEELVAGEGDFTRVDLALVTHHHADHFDPQTAMRFLERHSSTALVGTPEVLEALERQPGFDEVAGRVVVPALAWGECVNIRPNGIDIRVCRVLHSGALEISNHIYRVDLGGFRFLHEGDANLGADTFSGLELADEDLDLAFLHDWYVFSPEGRDVVADWISPRSIVLMHLRWEMIAAKRQHLAELTSSAAQELPPITIFGAERERASFDPGPQ